MPKFVTIGYGSRADYERTDAALRDAAHAQDARLLAAGAQIGVADSPVQVRNHDDAGVTVKTGSFMSSDLPVAGFAIIEADTLEEAIDMVSKVPCAIAQGVVEVWPLRETP